MVVEIPDMEVEGTGLTDALARVELAVALYRDRKVSLGRGARIARIPVPSFLWEVGRRGVTVNYDEAEFQIDLQNIESI